MGWAVAAGLAFSVLNTTMRAMTLQMHPFQAQFLRYAFGLAVMLPFAFRTGLASYRPKGLAGQLWRGVVHTIGLVLWFLALPHLAIAETTAIGFTTPIFTMLGAVLFLGEPMRWSRWLAALIGFAGVLVVVWPKLAVGGNGYWALAMVAAAPVFAASFLITKALTRRDTPAVIVFWQSLTVGVFSLPLAWTVWMPMTGLQWVLFALCGVLGSAGHYCLTHSLRAADVSATQGVKFLDLIWASLMGFAVFGDRPSQWTLAGGFVIVGSTLWLARREARAELLTRTRSAPRH
jgi:drug/metabolite transporter (DMT)-like permease